MTGQRAAPPAHHVLHAEPRTLLVQADRIERPAIPADHVPVLLVRRIEDRLQKVHEPVRAADVLCRTAPGPVHESRIFPVRVAVANFLDDHIVAPVVAVVVGVDEPIHAACDHDAQPQTVQGARTRGSRAAPSERDSAQSQRLFGPGGARPPTQAMIAFINEHRDTYGVEPICKVLPIAPSTYRLHAGRQRDPSLLPDRARRDPVLMEEIERVFETNYSVYGARKVWRQLRREGRDVARCTVERLMRDLGLAGAIRGKPVKTTVSDKGAACPLDKVNRQFQAPEPNRLWVADFTYVATWAGFVYVAFVIDAFARRIVGWRVSRTAHASFVLDALEQAIHARKPAKGSGLVHHSDSEYLRAGSLGVT